VPQLERDVVGEQLEGDRRDEGHELVGSGGQLDDVFSGLPNTTKALLGECEDPATARCTAIRAPRGSTAMPAES
jgi:hypothetical protein